MTIYVIDTNFALGVDSDRDFDKLIKPEDQLLIPSGVLDELGRRTSPCFRAYLEQRGKVIEYIPNRDEIGRIGYNGMKKSHGPSPVDIQLLAIAIFYARQRPVTILSNDRHIINAFKTKIKPTPGCI